MPALTKIEALHNVTKKVNELMAAIEDLAEICTLVSEEDCIANMLPPITAINMCIRRLANYLKE